MWPSCRKLGVAAITYDPLADVDLSKYVRDEPEELWAQLEASQKGSLRKVAYEMKTGDVIYVKQGPQIVGKGIVRGSYQFDYKRRLVDPYRNVWAHQVPVDWESDFEPDILLGAEPTTVLELSGERLRNLEAAITIRSVEATVTQDLDSLHDEETYGEGGKGWQFTSYYERNPKLRAAAILCHGTKCKICDFDFGEFYGERGAGYIEVHHLRPVSRRKDEVKVNPKNDMTVVCSNCHRMIHRKKDRILSLEEMKKLVGKSKGSCT